MLSSVFVGAGVGPGETVSIIQVCPAGGLSDPGFTYQLEYLYLYGFPPPPAGYVFPQGKELWPAGAMTCSAASRRYSIQSALAS
jgi:hypothetical protein